jgi:4-diphosphocytidyl-2-C-methyl-D-erythritol kinase
MSLAAVRRARVKAFAKINLDLRVLGRRADGFHELRTVFQTISLADTLEISAQRSRRTEILLGGNVEIADNLAKRAAQAVLDDLKTAARVEIRLRKTIPMGAGLGGGSSDAGAVLLALPALLGGRLPPERLIARARGLGSDVPFFLLGGTAVAVGRGTELYPLADHPPRRGLVVAPGIHVSTPEAYRALGREMSGCGSALELNTIEKFQSCVWDPCGRGAENDFEAVVFKQFPRLGALKRRLRKLGAETAMMSGSGSSLFGFFRTQELIDRAVKSFQAESVFPITLMSRARYQGLWRRWLKGLVDEGTWPPRSRDAR